ncbi:MAG: ABC transporter permease, partial [Gaiellaceae bacterium]
MTPQDKHPELLSSGAGLAGLVALESGSELGEQIDVKARGYWEQVWRRFRRDRVAIGSAIFIVLLILTCFLGAVIAERLLGHGPDDLFFDGVDDRLIPRGPWSHVTNPETGETQLFILGADSALGRDEFLRLLYGGRVSLEVAMMSTAGVMAIGTLLGAIAGYYRGWIDTIISRVTEVTMAFPALLFIIALASTIGSRLDNVTFGIFGRGVVTLVLVFVMFGWFYPCRIIRAQVLSLREKEFIEAARM